MIKHLLAAETGIAAADRALVRKAERKLKAGGTLTREERGLLRQEEKRRAERRRWECYRRCPQKDYRAMSGRQTKVLHEQAERYGVPIGRAVIDLTAVIRWMHDYLARYGRRQSLAEGDDPLLVSGEQESPDAQRWLAEYRKQRSEHERLIVEQMKGVLVPRSVVRDALTRLALLLRRTGERLGREFGEAARKRLEETLDDFDQQLVRELKSVRAENGDGRPAPPCNASARGKLRKR